MSKFVLGLGSLCLAIASMLIFDPSARAQETPRVDVFGGYSYLSADTNNLASPSRQSANGWEASVSWNYNRWFAVEGDFSGYYKTYPLDVAVLGLGISEVNLDFHDYGYVGGPRFNFRPVFFHALVGGDHLTGSVPSVVSGSASQNSFAAAFGGGVQIPVAPRWAVRGSADYVLTRHNIYNLIPGLSGPAYTQNNFRVSVGVVYTFGSTYAGGSHASSGELTKASVGEESVLLGITGYGRDDGVVITSVRDSSPAARAGIQAGDVITGIDGEPVHSGREIETAIGTSKTGTVRVMYFRSGVLQIEQDVKIR